MRIAIANIAVAATWELLQSPEIPDERLATLQRDWSDAEFLQGAENALMMTRAMCEATTARLHESSSEFRSYATTFSRSSPSGWFDRVASSTMLKAKESLWRVVWSDPDELRMLRGQQAMLETFRRAASDHAFGAALRDQETRLAALELFKPDAESESGMRFLEDIDASSMMSRSVLSFQLFPQRVFRMGAAQQIVIAAIALKRYQLRHGTYPAQLSGIAPEVLTAVPRDSVDGNRLRYRLNSDGTFTLYSIGQDEKDDGGDPSPAGSSKSKFWLQARDWVWPQPAREDEIAIFYADEAATRAGPVALAEFEKRYGLSSTNHKPPLTNSRLPVAGH